jgi:membrane dipeptidase
MVAGKMENLKRLYEKGVRAMALTWNFPNCFGYPNSSDETIMKRGLTDFGKEAIGEMNRLGMLVDVSHLSDGGFYDVAQISRKPFIASHSNCRALTPHPRNLTDDMIRILAEHGGVTGLNFAPQFVSRTIHSKDCRIEDLVRHTMHLVQVGGEDCVGIGTDFDGVGGNLEIHEPAQVDRLFEALKKAGLTERQLDKIARENVLRVFKDIG